MNLRKILSIALAVCLLVAQVATVAYAEEIPAEAVETVQEASEAAETQLAETEIAKTETEKATEEKTGETKVEESAKVEPVEEKKETQAETVAEEASKQEENKDADVTGDIFLEYSLGDVIVTLKADKDAFKDVVGELKLSVVELSDEEVESQVDEALKTEETENVAKRITYDITVSDDEKEQQPVKPVKVEFNLKDAPSGADGINIFHHDETEGVEKIATKVLKEDAQEETAKIGETKTEGTKAETAKAETVADKTIEIKEVTEEELAETDDVELIDDVTVGGTTNGFSLYTVDFTYKDMTISITGNSNGNKLDDITKQLGIEEKIDEAATYQNVECEGDPTNGEVKSEEGKTLFSVYEIDNSWYVDAVNAFQTEHGLIVRTVDGAEYKIKVTDAVTAVSYRYPVYNTPGDPTSGIASWNDGSSTSHISVESTNTQWGPDTPVAGTEYWYVVDDNITISNTVTVKGDVHLILMDGCKLTVSGSDNEAGICVRGTNSLVIYGQTNGTGNLTATGGTNAAGIGGGKEESGSNITINGGTVTATGVWLGAGIGGGWGESTGGSGSNININGGKVEANGGDSSAGIGGGGNGTGSDITINGGTVTATGGAGGAGIGGGCNGEGKDIKINGGSVTAKGGDYAAGIGGGCRDSTGGSGSDITINGGTVTATGGAGGAGGAGIGGGCNGEGKVIKINGGSVTAKGGDYAAGIGGGFGGTGSSIYVADAIVVKADVSTNPPTTVIAHASSATDISVSLAGKKYAKAEEVNTSVSLDANGGTTGTKNIVTASYGSAMPALLSTELPTRSGYGFTGYFDASLGGTKYYNADGTSAKNWDRTDATATLYAQWIANIYTVTFDMQGHGTQVESQMVAGGGIVTKPTDPSATDYTFGGWYKEKGCSNAWDFDNDTVNADTTLFAKWTSKGGDEPTPPTPTPEPTPEPAKKSSNSGAWTAEPTSSGSSSAPVSNGTWTNPSGSFKYIVNGEPFRNTTAWITYTGSDGKQYTGCFYFDRDGIMQVGWQKINDAWYYFEPTAGPTQGMMKVTGWVETNGKLYYLGADGKMLVNTITPDGKRVGDDGALIQ